MRVPRVARLRRGFDSLSDPALRGPWSCSCGCVRLRFCVDVRRGNRNALVTDNLQKPCVVQTLCLVAVRGRMVGRSPIRQTPVVLWRVETSWLVGELEEFHHHEVSVFDDGMFVCKTTMVAFGTAVFSTQRVAACHSCSGDRSYVRSS